MKPRQMATPQPIRYGYRFRAAFGSTGRHAKPVRFKPHQGCIWTSLTILGQIAGGLVLLVILLALMGTGPW